MGDILENILWVSVMILVGYVLRLICGQRFGVLWRKLLWGILAIRMLIPFQVHFGIERVLKLSAGLSYTGALRDGVIRAGITGQNQYSMSRMGFFLHMPILYIMVFLSICISIYLVCRHHERYGFAINRLRVSLQDTGKRVGGMEVYESECVTSPMIFGYHKPVLLLPKHGISEADLKYIFAHESTHYRMKDLWYKRLILFVNDVFWFNPFMYLMRRMAYEDVELYCDEVTTAGYDEQEKGRYCEAMLSFSANRNNKFALEFASDTRKLRKRISAVFEQKNWKRGMGILAGCILGFLACESILGVIVENPVKNGTYEISESTIRGAMLISEERLNSLEEFGQVTIQYSYGLDRPAYSQEELNDNLQITVSTSKYEELSELMRDSVGAYVNSWFGWKLENIQVTGE